MIGRVRPPRAHEDGGSDGTRGQHKREGGYEAVEDHFGNALVSNARAAEVEGYDLLEVAQELQMQGQIQAKLALKEADFFLAGVFAELAIYGGLAAAVNVEEDEC